MLLGIIITGQIRDFFSKNTIKQFIDLITRSKQFYNISLFCVINDANFELIKNNFNDLSKICENIELINFAQYIDKHSEKIKEKTCSEKFINNVKKYYEKDDINENMILQMSDRIFNQSIQHYQLQIGIEKLIEYENTKNIKFDVIMKTRFDLKYSHYFIPLMRNNPCSFFEKLNHNSVLLNKFTEKMKEVGLVEHNFISELKNKNNNNIQEIRKYNGINFGCYYSHNYITLERVKERHYKNEPENIIYSYRDYLFFGKREDIILLKDLYNSYALLDNYFNIKMLLLPETELIAYCLLNNINILCYPTENEMEPTRLNQSNTTVMKFYYI